MADFGEKVLKIAKEVGSPLRKLLEARVRGEDDQGKVSKEVAGLMRELKMERKKEEENFQFLEVEVARGQARAEKLEDELRRRDKR
jgi:predicted RNA binding protein with dsRBD fold (UPF0201 family)